MLNFINSSKLYFKQKSLEFLNDHLLPLKEVLFKK